MPGIDGLFLWLRKKTIAELIKIAQFRWILAILLGVGSCVCFISLYWFTLRSFLTGGESQLIPAFITVSAGVVVGSVSLLVNLIECTGPRGKK